MREYSELNSKITGDIAISKSNYGGEEITTVTWQGGDVIGITGNVVEDIASNKVEHLYATKHGSFVTIGEYTVKIFDYFEEFDIYLAKRVN
jgi:hypothetical protein